MARSERYSRNGAAFSEDEQELVGTKRALIVGCGGLGGFVGAGLARFGIGTLTLVDGDVFIESNLNRQLFATESNMGQRKVEVMKAALAAINSGVRVEAVPEMLSVDNAAQLVAGHDIALDCLDNISARFLLAEACADADIPLIHGAVAGFYGQVANVFPGDDIMERIYPRTDGFAREPLGAPVFAPQLVAAIQCCEALKILAGREDALRNAMLYVDMLNNTSDVISFDK